MIVLSENFRALFYAPFYAAYATGAFRDGGVGVPLRPSPDPPAAARALRSGEVDVMWGGPLRVMIVHDSEPDADLVCFADVVARDPFFVIGARPRPDFRLADLATVKFASVSEVPTPWICLADDLRRAGVRVDRPARPPDLPPLGHAPRPAGAPRRRSFPDAPGPAPHARLVRQDAGRRDRPPAEELFSHRHRKENLFLPHRTATTTHAIW